MGDSGVPCSGKKSLGVIVMEDNFLADLRRAITHGKVEVWVSVRDVEERYPTSYHIESYQDIFDVVREDLQKYIDYDWVEKHFVLEEIIVDREEIDLGLVDAYGIFKQVYARKLKEYPSERVAHEEALKERNMIIQKNEEEIWEKMKNGKKVELEFGWYYA